MQMLDLLVKGITPDTSATFTSTVVISGVVIVFLVLVILIAVFYAFGAIVSKGGNKTQKKKISKPTAPVLEAAQAASTVSTAPSVKDSSEEIVAAITAAIHEYEGSSDFVITSIAPVAVKPPKKNPINTRNPWAKSAVIANTRPF